MKYRAMVILENDSALPADVVVNTFYFDDDSPDDPTENGDSTIDAAVAARVLASGTEILDRLALNYQGNEAMFGAGLSGTVRVKIYNMADPTEPAIVGVSPGIQRPVVFEDTFTIVPGSTQLPAELAMCVSFHADQPGGVPPGRLRGRVYLGPLIVATAGTLTTGDIPFNPAYQTFGRDFGNYLLSRNGDGLTWAIYSPTIDASGSLASAFNDVVGGYCDNAFDVQRRRGHKATNRNVFP